MTSHKRLLAGSRPFVPFLVGLCLACALTARAMGQFAMPPMPRTDLNWKVPTDPANGFTRTVYRSFLTDPHQPLAWPDYTYDGFIPWAPDSWSGGGPYGTNFGPGPADDIWGDGVGLTLSQGELLDVVLGNYDDPEYTKKYFVEIVWRPWDEILTDPISLSVQAPLATSSQTAADLIGPDAHGWYLQRWEGRIRPQPESEQFSFLACETAEIDSMWIATQCCILKPFHEYGIDINGDGDWSDPSEGPAWNREAPDGICQAVATANSFAYLQNHYGVPLIPPDADKNEPRDKVTVEDLIAVRDKLADGWGDIPGIYGEGTEQEWWTAKYRWIEEHAEGQIIFDGQVHGVGTFAGWPGGDVLEDKYPEWNFLWEQLKKCEDVELAIDPVTGTGDGHALTLTGLCWDDADGDGVFDSGEGMLYYLDPNDTDQKSALVTRGVDGRLEFEYWKDNADWYIALAFSESIPEPTILGLLAVGALALIRRRRQ